MSGQTNLQPVNVEMQKFVSAYKRSILRLSNKLNDYITSPDEKNIHDLRTTVRRMHACYMTLPKTMRKKASIKKYVNKSKELFRINSQIRDFDIILQLISKNDANLGGRNSLHLTKYKNRKASKLENAKVIAVQLSKLPVPKLDKNKMSCSKLTMRYNNLLSRFLNRIQLNLPSIVADADKVAELHEMRKDCKKLRYLLELLPHGNSLDNNLCQLVRELRIMQDLLGAVRDCDAAISYYNQHAVSRRDITKSIIQERKIRYEDFRIHCRSYLRSRILYPDSDTQDPHSYLRLRESG